MSVATERLDRAIARLGELRADLVAAYERGDLDAAQVCWRSLHDWVRAHSGIAAAGDAEVYEMSAARLRGEPPAPRGGE